MPAKLKNRTIYYRRVGWLDGSTQTLETYLIGAHQKLASANQRVFQYHEGEIFGLQNTHKKGVGSMFHVAEYVPHQRWTVVPFASGKSSQNTGIQAPPAEKNFMVGEVFFLVSGDHVLICPSGAREAVVEAYIHQVLRAVNLDDISGKFSLNAVADINKINMIKTQGVKSVEMNASLYEATTEYHARKDVRETLMHNLSRSFLSMFANDPNSELRDISTKENLQVKLLISFDKRKEGEIGQKRLSNVAQQLISSDEEDGFTIITGENQRLKANEIRISESFQFEPRGNSISRVDAFDYLELYLENLKRMGVLQQ